MNSRKKRQSEIVSLIGAKAVSTQRELIAELAERGINVTQATVSRDITELQLIKKLGTDGRAVYSLNRPGSEPELGKYRNILTGTAVSADYALNTCVVKTHVGMANAACAAIDALNFEGTVGTLAGDDTIFVLCRTVEDTENFCRLLNALIEEKNAEF